MGFAFTTNGDIITPQETKEDIKKYLSHQKAEIIEKACERIKKYINDYYYFEEINNNAISIKNLVEDFRKKIEK